VAFNSWEKNCVWVKMRYQKLKELKQLSWVFFYLNRSKEIYNRI